MPKYENQCPVNFEIDLFESCDFNCVYCISNSKKTPIQAVDQSIIDFKKYISYNNPECHPVYFSPWTDAYQKREETSLRTQKAITGAVELNNPFFIITRSLLVMRDMNIIKKSKNAFVAVSINTADNDVIKILEPGADDILERIKMIKILISEGIRTVIKIDPVIPGITDGERLKTLLHIIAEIKPYAVTMETLRLTSEISAKLKTVLSAQEYHKMVSYYPVLNDQPVHPSIDYRLEVFKIASKFFSIKGIKTSFCKASLPEKLSPYDCRGGF